MAKIGLNFGEKLQIADKSYRVITDGLDIPAVFGKLTFRGMEGSDIIYELDRTQRNPDGSYVQVNTGEIRGVVNQELQVYDGLNRFGAFKPDPKWQRLFGGVEPLKLTTSPQPYSLERTIRWLMYQVSNSLALVEEADKILQTEYMKIIQNQGEITDRGKIMLKDLTNNHTLVSETRN